MTTQYQMLKDTYDIVSRVEEKLDKVEDRVSVLEMWKVEITARIGVLVAIVSVGSTMAWEWLRQKVLKI